MISSTHLADEKDADIQQTLNAFKPGEKLQYVHGLSPSRLSIHRHLPRQQFGHLYFEKVNSLSKKCPYVSMSIRFRSIIEAPFITYTDIKVGSLEYSEQATWLYTSEYLHKWRVQWNRLTLLAGQM